MLEVRKYKTVSGKSLLPYHLVEERQTESKREQRWDSASCTPIASNSSFMTTQLKHLPESPRPSTVAWV